MKPRLLERRLDCLATSDRAPAVHGVLDQLSIRPKPRRGRQRLRPCGQQGQYARSSGARCFLRKRVGRQAAQQRDRTEILIEPPPTRATRSGCIILDLPTKRARLACNEAARLIVHALENKYDVTLQSLTGRPELWTSDFWQSLQRRLEEKGIYSGTIDGRPNPATLDAIRRLAGRG